MQQSDKRYRQLAPCGVFCEACPSFDKTCLGCGSEKKEQNRISKWTCRIRICCYKRGLNYCIHCDEFPCKIIRKKLLDTHHDENKFTYRHEIPAVFKRLKSMTVEDYLAWQRKRWSCNSCDGMIKFYDYTCNRCGKEILVKEK